MVRRRRRSGMGKRIVYITPYRNLAVEVMRMYLKHGEEAWIEREVDASGTTLFLVYLFAE